MHVFADLHLGDSNTDMKLVKDRLKVIEDTPNAYCILNGDIMNNATKTSISDIYSEKLTPMEQIQQTVELFEPIKDRILAITGGNHDGTRTYKKEGIDLMSLAAQQLGLQDRYSRGAALIFLRFGDTGPKCHNLPVCYVIYTLHGTGGGRKEGAKAIRLADMAANVDSDIYIHSHTHLPMIFHYRFRRPHPQNRTSAWVDHLFVNTAATLDYGGYAEQQEYKPASKRNPIIRLSGKKKYAEATL